MTMHQHYIPPGEFQFRFGREIGRGGLGRVHEVCITGSNCSKAVGEWYACKRLNGRFDRHPVLRARFEREIAVVRQMTHPGIVSYEGENLPDGPERFYLMPLYANSLRDRLSHGGPSPWRRVAAFGADLAEAMAHAHARGMIHRDLKPENILFDSGGNAVIADWGLGYFVHKQSLVLKPLTVGGMGTEYYCCLEQWNTGKCDETGHIYSLGVVLAELVRGYQLPLRLGMGVQEDVVVNDRSPPAGRFNVLIRRMTAILPRGRPQSMREVAAHLRSCV